MRVNDARVDYQRLSALDASFLAIEDEQTHMHVGAVILFEAGPLQNEHGGVDFDKIRRYIQSAIARVPRYRQRLRLVPVIKHPVWVDDDRFNIHYHVRHTALPQPGDDRTLKRLCGRIFSVRLDRERPLWEMWVVEGLADGRFALITKAHHAMIDGVAGVDLMVALLRMNRDDSVPDLEPWEPAPPPDAKELLKDELQHRAKGPRRLLEILRAARDNPDAFVDRARSLAEGLRGTLGAGLVPASPTPINGPVGPHRRFDWHELPLADVKTIKRSLGGTVNDAVLAIVTGAFRRFLARRGASPNDIEDFRTLVPVAVRDKQAHGGLGNRVAMLLAPLPVSELDPAKRFAKIHSSIQELKDSPQIESTTFFEEVGDVTGTGLISAALRLSSSLRAYNTVVTNVPGPPVPLYLLGAELVSVYPLVPLFLNQHIGIALFSYCGRICLGLNADWQAVTDLHDFTADLQAAFDELLSICP